jgi:hypothetical protein
MSEPAHLACMYRRGDAGTPIAARIIVHRPG